MGVACFLGGMSRGLLGRNHALHIRQVRPQFSFLFGAHRNVAT